MNPAAVTRRGFLTAGSGLFVLFRVGRAAAQQAEPAQVPFRVNYPTDFNAYLKIGADGRVTCMVGKVELGQGGMTTLAECLAEELDVAFDSIDMVMGDTDLCPFDMGTFGSMCAPLYTPVVRKAGAEARAVLLQMAAEKISAPVARLKVSAGVITDTESNQRVTYAELVAGKRIERHLTGVPVKSPAAFTVLGRPARRKDALDKVTGKAKYAGDMTLPGMLCARILRPPAHGATLQSVDTSAAEKAGARVVKEGDLVAVLHERRDIADAALDQVKAQFDRPKTGVDDKNIFEHIQKTGPAAKVATQKGDVAEGEKLADQIIEENYLNAYVSHATLETHAALANFENGRCTVWASTQAPFSVKTAVASALGIPPERVRIITPYVGGGFGGKSEGPQAVEAARLSRLAGKPVQVVRERDEEFFYDTFRPAAVVKIRSGLTAANRIPFWDAMVWGGGEREAGAFYDIPHQRVAFSGGWQGGNPPGMHPFGVGAWRAPSVNTNTFARESHIDTMAAKAGIDPVEFRLSHLTDARMRRVLEAVAKQFGWKAGKAPSGRGAGVACGIYSDTHVATMAEVEVDKATGKVRVKRVVMALDQGLTLNPDGMRQQAEGAITMGLGYTLTEEVRFRDGEVLDRNFDTYELPRFSTLPKIEVILIENRETPALGGGEPPIITTGAVVANAIFDAIGKRLKQLPMTPERVKAG